MEKFFAAASAVLVALSYFTGFCYLWFYYQFYGVSPIELDVGIQFVFVHSFTALWIFLRSFWLFLILALIVLVLTYRIPRIRTKLQECTKSPTYMALFLCVFVTLALYHIAAWSGDKKARQDLEHLPPLTLKMKSGEDVDFKDSRGRQAYLLASTQNRVFSVIRFSPSNFWVVRIPADSIAATQTFSE